MLLIGGSIAFAGGALNDHARNTAPRATPPPPPPLTLIAPRVAITRADRLDLTVVVPVGLRQDQGYRVRVYVNGERVRERDLPTADRFVLEGVPLARGENSIRASLVGAGGESERSAAVSVVRDDEAPVIRISQPAAGAPVYARQVTLLGRTEPGATISITDVAAGDELDAALQADGRFSAELTLAMGSNRFVLSSVDTAGNRSSTRLTITRADSAASLTLAISPEEVVAADLPAQVTLTAVVRDEQGRLVEGATVTFSVSPPDRETTTYRAMTAAGRARWSGLTLDPGDAPGTWLVTASATLPSGEELRQDGSFRLE